MTYKLELPANWKTIHPVFNVSKLRRHTQDPAFPDTPPPEPVVVDEEPEYVVEEVRNSRWYRRRFEYLVRWVGYPPEYDSWEPVSNLGNAEVLVKAYHEKFPDAPNPAAPRCRALRRG